MSNDNTMTMVFAASGFLICMVCCCSSSSSAFAYFGKTDSSTTTTAGTTVAPAGTTAATSAPGATTTTTPATTIAVIKPRLKIGDPGYADNALPTFGRKRGWYDASGQGVPNDYCRYVGSGGIGDGINWSCERADGFYDWGTFNSAKPASTYAGGDKGYADGSFPNHSKKRGYWTFTNGKEGYCRYVGAGDKPDWSCDFGEVGKGYVDPTNTIGKAPAV